MKPPMISIIIPCYNQAQYLDEAVSSVLSQSFTDWEIIIVNDGSQDATQEVAEKWAQKDSRIQVLSIENGGLANARNTGIASAKGIYILPLDADDKIASFYLEKAFEAFLQDPNLTIFYGKAQKFGFVNEPWKLREYSLNSIAYGNMIYCSAVFKKEDWKRVGGYDLQMKYGLEDWEFWISIVKNGNAKVKQLEEVCFYYRVKEVSMITQLDQEKEKEMHRYVSEKHTQFLIDQMGSFHELAKKNAHLKKKLGALSKSKKHALNTLLSVKLFKNIKL